MAKADAYWSTRVDNFEKIKHQIQCFADTDLYLEATEEVTNHSYIDFLLLDCITRDQRNDCASLEEIE